MALSSTKEEFINLTSAGQTAIWIANILKEADCLQKTPYILFTDSANAQQIALKPENAARMRHIDICYKWIQNRIKKDYFKLKHILIINMIADGLIKPLGREKFAQFVKMISVGPCPWWLVGWLMEMVDMNVMKASTAIIWNCKMKEQMVCSD